MIKREKGFQALRAYIAAMPVFKFRGYTSLALLSMVAGLLAGLAKLLFSSMQDLVHRYVFEGGMEVLGVGEGGLHLMLLPLLPMAGAVLLIPLSLLFPGEVNGYGLPRFIERVNFRDGVIEAKKFFLTILSSSFTIGTGGSAGIEGPIAVVGGATGSFIGQKLGLPANGLKTLTAAGAAGGIAAIFNAPLAGVMFALEIVLMGNYTLVSFSAIVISSGIATAVTRACTGNIPLLNWQHFDMINNYEIFLYIILGTLAGVLSRLFILVFHKTGDFFARLPIHSQIKPVAGAFLVGLTGILYFQTLGNGYGVIEDALAGKIALTTMCALIFVKMAATSLTLGSGNAGGVFAPCLMIGAMIGGSFGSVLNLLGPGMVSSAGAYSTVGIGAFLAGVTHAPLTAIFLLVEVTGDYLIMVPAMLASIFATLVSRAFSKDSIDTYVFARQGIEINEGLEVSIMEKIKVGDVMEKNFPSLPPEVSVKELMETMYTIGRFSIPLIDAAGTLAAMVSIQDIAPLIREGRSLEGLTAMDIAAGKVFTLFPLDSFDTAREKFMVLDVESIPVIEPGEKARAIGLFNRRDMRDVYNKELLVSGYAKLYQENPSIRERG